MRRIVPAIGLFFLSPLIAEFLLGDIPMTGLYALIGLAPLYGGGALLIREVCRRAGWGWPSILTLSLAYGVLEEAVCTQSLFNPNFGGKDLHLLAPGYVPALGIGVPYTLFVLTLHVVWSIGVPIALVELATRQRRGTPWLGRIGIGVCVVLFAIGVTLNLTQSRADSDFSASTVQLVVSGLVVLALVALAAFLGRQAGRRADETRPATLRTPPALVLGLVSLLATSAFLTAWYSGRNTVPAWVFVGLVIAVYAATILLVGHWSRRSQWTPLHQLGLAGGALLSYAWHGFFTAPFMPASAATQLIGHVVFALGAVLLLTMIALRLRGEEAEAPATAPHTPTPHAAR